MRYDSFLLRYWRRESECRIEVSHLQSGGRTCLATLIAAIDWIDAQDAPMPDSAADTRTSTGSKEVQRNTTLESNE